MATTQRAAEPRISVKIGAFPGGQIKSYDFAPNTSIEDGLKEARLNVFGRDETPDVRVNGTRASSLTAPMRDNDQILVFSKVRGN